MSKTKLVLFLTVALLLPLAAPGRAVESCSGSGNDAFLASLQAPQSLPQTLPERAVRPVPKATFCTKEVCSAARQECRNGCPFPCTMTFECVAPSCGSCISCSC